MLANIRIVLVRPQGAANLGATARAMMNMGLRELVLVAPRCSPADEPARNYATRARPLLDSARIVETIPDALLGCVASFATSAKGGFYRKQVAVDAQTCAELALRQAADGPVAIAFGPEDRGLVLEELLYFDRIVEIPANPEYPVLNLAAAVMVMGYELWRAAPRGQEAAPLPLTRQRAPDERRQLLYAKLFDALERIDFFFGPNPDHLKYALRHLLGRVDMSISEADILIGMAQQIRWYADHHPHRIDPSDA